MINNRLGAKEGASGQEMSSADMYRHVQDVFDVGDETHQALLRKEMAASVSSVVVFVCLFVCLCLCVYT